MSQPLSTVLSSADHSSESNSSTRAAIYARTSSASQKFGYSIDEQVRQCVDRCQIMGWTPAFIFRDEAISGKDPNRPMFQKMLARAEQSAFDVLVFWKLDRFSRSIMHAVQLENEFREMGVALHSVTEQLDTTTAAGRFNFRNIANAAEFERDMIKQRTKMGHTALAMNHKWPNSAPPFGYERLEDGKLSILPQEASLVRWIFKTYLVEKSMPKVTTLLCQKEAIASNTREWTVGAVNTTLKNPIYKGRYSVGEVHDSVEEYRIVSDRLFEEVTDVRNRFQNSQTEARPSMGGVRKRKIVEEINDQYSDFLS